MQIQLSSSPKSKMLGSMVDALEDDIVKKLETEHKEKEKMLQMKNENKDKYMIFERHFEDGKEEPKKEESKEEKVKDSIDAEPFQFLESNIEIEKEQVVLEQPKVEDKSK